MILGSSALNKIVKKIKLIFQRLNVCSKQNRKKFVCQDRFLSVLVIFKRFKVKMRNDITILKTILELYFYLMITTQINDPISNFPRI